MNKYRNTKTMVCGIAFDSQKEANRYLVLKNLEKAGVIKDLMVQKKFVLIPSQRVNGRVVERPLTYTADFAYYKDNQLVVEDVKGYRDPASAGHAKYIIKRKCMLWFYGIQITEI